MPVGYSHLQCVELTSFLVGMVNAAGAKYPVACDGMSGVCIMIDEGISTVAMHIILTNDSKREHVF